MNAIIICLLDKQIKDADKFLELIYKVNLKTTLYKPFCLFNEDVIAYHALCNVVLQGANDQKSVENGSDRRTMAGDRTVDTVGEIFLNI